jgi:hypothetical protein
MRTLICFAFVVLVAACSPDGPNEAEMAAEEAAAEQAVVEFFDALGKLDHETAQSAVTSEFELVQDTVALDWDALVEYARPLEDAGATVSYEFSDFNTTVRGSVAWTRYRSRSVFEMNGQATRSEWLESAVLERIGDRWRIDRFHSTPIWIEAEEG